MLDGVEQLRRRSFDKASFLLEQKAIFFPSGDHAGHLSLSSPRSDYHILFPPSTMMTCPVTKSE